MSRRRSLSDASARQARSFSFIGSSYARRLRVETLEDRRMLALLTVTNLNDSGAGSLREAITTANGSTGVADDIIFDAGLRGVINLASQLPTITDPLTIDGDNKIGLNARGGADGTVGNGDGYRIFDIDDDDADNDIDVSLSGLALTGGDVSGVGGAIRNTENLTLQQSNITGNAASTTGNTANSAGGGGIYTYSGAVTLTDSMVSENNSRGDDAGGGGILSRQSTLTLMSSTVSGNSTRGSFAPGGGIFSRQGTVTLVSSTVSGNSTSRDFAGGGGIAASSSALTLTSSTVSGNYTSGRDSSGGGIAATSGTLTITSSTVTENSTSGARANGGGIRFQQGTVTLVSSMVSENNSSGNGGGIHTRHTELILADSTVSENTGDDGGGISTRYGALTLTRSTVSGNSVSGSVDQGGGIHTVLTAVALLDSTVTNNASARSSGGGVYVGNSSGNPEFTISNSIIAGNTAAGTAPDLRPNPGSTLDISHSLIGDNAGTALTEAQVADGNGNLIGSAAGGGIINPRLGPLADNGGPTFTHALLDDSPAIDAGNSALLIDQRGLPRPFDVVSLPNTTGNGSDIGAFERQTAPSTFLPSDVTVFFETTSDVDLSPTRIIEESGAAVTVTLTVSGGEFAAPADGSGVGGGVTASLADPQVVTLVGRADDVNFYLDNPANLQYSPPAGVVGDNAAAIAATVDGTLLGTVSLNVLELPSLVVDTTADVVDMFDLVTSLREAIALADNSSGADTITFDAGVFTGGTANQIDLDGSQLEVFDSLTIDATALTENVTIDAQQMSRVLMIGTERDTFDVSLAGLSITGGDVGRIGGGVLFNARGTLTLNQSEVSRNTGAGGGGIASLFGALTLTDSTVTENSTRGDYVGGGILTDSGAVTLIDSTVSGNSTTGRNAPGGGIFTDSGAITLTRSTVTGNSTVGSRADGGGISTDSGAITLTNSTVSGNSTAGFYAYGGGIKTFSGAVTLNSSTVSGNSTTDSGAAGGGIFTFFGSVTLIDSTVAGNTAAQAEGGGVFNVNSYGSPTFTMENSIIAGNSAGRGSPDLQYDLSSTLNISYSLIGDNEGTTFTEAQTADGNGNLIGSAAGSGIIDPLLGPLADNGGPTQTHALLPGSPALNSGDPSIPFLATEFDQRGVGYSRVAFDRIDIGAYEAHVTSSADFDADGDVDGSDFLAWQRGFGKANALRTDGNSDDDTDVDASDLAVWTLSYGNAVPPPAGELSAVSDQPLAAASGQLVDAAMAWALLDAPVDDETEAVDEQPTLDASAFASSVNVRVAATPQSRTAYRSEEDASDADDTADPWLSDELLEQVFR